MLKLETLRVFVNVAEVGNIREAAERMGRTPSAVSMSLAQIEDQIGARLFESDRKNKLTALGNFVLESARPQIEGYDRTLNMIRAFANNRIGQLTLASVPSVAANVLAPLLQEFIADWPGIEVEIFDQDSANVRTMVESGQVELGIAGRPKSEALVTFVPLFRDQFKLVVPLSSALADESEITWQDLDGETLIVNGASQVIEAPEYRAAAQKASLTVRNVTSLTAFISIGLGVTLLPELSTRTLPRTVKVLDLEDDRAYREVGLLQRRATVLSPVASEFYRHFTGVLPALLNVLELSPPKTVR